MAGRRRGELSGVDRTLAALADPTRRRAIELLRERPRRPTDLAAALQVTPAALSRHLRVLRQCELVDDARDPDDNRVRVYRLRQERLAALHDWLASFWSAQLDAFVADLEDP